MTQTKTMQQLLQEKGIHGEEILKEFDPSLLEQYLSFLISNNEIGGFFSKGDSEVILERHLYESMVFAKTIADLVEVSRETRVVDVGTGPGLPGFLFACLLKRPHLTLMDSSKRRLQFLENFVKEKPELKGVHFLYQRAEEATKKFSIITARALIPYPSVLEILLPMTEKGTDIFLFQSKASYTDSPRELDYLRKLGMKHVQTIPLPELSFLGDRNIIHLNKRAPAEKGYPRSWKIIKEEMKLWEK